MSDDLISRQAGIDAIRASTSKYTGFMEMEMYTDDDAVEAINGVPSAQQCMTATSNTMMRETVKIPVMDGTTERLPTADVRENIQLDVCPLYGGACGYPSGECYDCPRHGNFRENVRGEWLIRKDTTECSNCHTKWRDYRGLISTFYYCPNCGADMRGEA